MGMTSPNILIVDDDPIILRLLKKKLESSGATVVQAQDGKQGLEKALSDRFDLIISDVEMPYLDGFRLCEKLKSGPETRQIPVIILSSQESDRAIDRGFEAGAAGYVPKSEAQFRLNETIQRVLEKAKFQRNRLILVVDDSFTIRRLVQKGLEEAGFQVMTAGDGHQALKLISKSRPDLILSDLDMPRMDGIDFCKKVHGDPDLAAIPFVIMSASSDRATMRRMLQRGASAFLVKPFNLEQLVITTEKLLSDHFLILLKDRERLEREKDLILESITSLIAALEARDHYTRGHSEAVAMLVAQMAAHMGAPSEDVDALTIAGRLHDLGKIGIPDSILLKPGRLTDEEFNIIKQHPVVGARILGSISSIKPLMPVILHHHERFDGYGYPDGLKGEKIPLWARMTAVADTYHALTSDRPYRKGMPWERALEIIDEVRGSQLCPLCVDLFLEMVRDQPKEVKRCSWGT